MARNNTLFYLSGFISFLVFFSVITLFMMIIVDNTTKNFALKKDKYVKVSIDLTENRPVKKQKKQIKKKQKEIVKKEKIVEKPKKKAVAKPADFSSLFSNVKAQKIVHKKKKVKPKKIDTAQINQIQKRIKTTKKRESSISKTIESLEISKSADKKNTKTVSTASQINEIAAKITEIIYSRFIVDSTMLGNVVTIRISIDGYGRLTDYRILQTSASESLNKEALALKKRLLHVSFPKTKDYKAYSVKINLIPEDK
jgi:outer membrane biosynthesis protein TonB